MNKNYINPNSNDDFSKLSEKDLAELIAQVNNYYLEYRTQLGLPDDLTFGVEVEYEWALKRITDRFIENNMPGWKSGYDCSLRFGGEINSPVMRDNERYWQELQLICNHLKKRHAKATHNAGGHIHVGSCILGDDILSWRIFLKLYTVYEHILFRFAYGDKVNARKNILIYAPPIADILYKLLDVINKTSEARWLLDLLIIKPDKNAALNFHNVQFSRLSKYYDRNTLEFRSPNGTTSAVIWQNNINVFTKMLVAARKKVIDEEFLNFKLENQFVSYLDNAELYYNIDLKKALEFADLVFDNNLDKVYFLRQYLKNFQNGYGKKRVIIAKRFVKEGIIK